MVLAMAILVLVTMARGLPMLSQRLMLVCTMVVMVLAMATLVLVTMARGLLMLSQRLKLMLVFSMEPMDMVLVLDMLDSDMDIPVLDMLDMVVMELDTAVLAMLVLDTMARGLLMLS